MIFFFTFLVVAFASLSAFCANKKVAQGDITMKVSANIAQINLGESNIMKGQRLAVFRQECHGGRFAVCTKDRVGGGRVTRVFDKKYSEIALDPGVHFDVGYIVEQEPSN